MTISCGGTPLRSDILSSEIDATRTDLNNRPILAQLICVPCKHKLFRATSNHAFAFQLSLLVLLLYLLGSHSTDLQVSTQAEVLKVLARRVLS